MLTIQCTKKLASEILVPMAEVRENAHQSLYSWHAHLFLFKRKKYVLLMNNKTRYNFVLAGLKKEDFKKFNKIFLNNLAENLQADQIDSEAIKAYVSNGNIVSYTSTSNRSIISQMNEMIMVSKSILEEDNMQGIETDLYELNRFLNRFVMLKLPETYSGEAMRKVLSP
ncbi:DUF6933 domain-containing protein [Bacillus taeanensis]|nr:hypothetical protein [Bacillus taeanensis]